MADLDHYKKYGWKISETNLETLPKDAPQAARDLAKWLTLEGRRSSLEEWLGCVSDDGKIHGKFWPIGAWTHRMSHSNPNQANIPSVFHMGDYDPEEDNDKFVVKEKEFATYDDAYQYGFDLWSLEENKAVDIVKAKYDGKLRKLFNVGKDKFLVGCDASGIQLRILAHYMKSKEYVEAIVNGSSKDGTDIHNLNRKALKLNHIDRDDTKTFIYAWLLGAGVAKVASILHVTTPQAKKAMDDFLNSLPDLKRVKEIDIPRDASRGFFVGLDGRKVKCTSAHLMLAGYLQNGEAVIMKRATLKWMRQLRKELIDFKLVNLVHDEWQVEITGTYEDAVRAGEIISDSLRQVGEELKLYCPLAGEYRIGKNWRDTH